MKKIVTLLLCTMLVLSGCNSGMDTSSEDHEETAKSDTTTEEPMSQMEDNTNDNKADDESQSEQEGADIHDENQVMAFFYELYLENVTDDIIQEKAFVAQNIAFAYDDYNNDGQEDVLCYSQNPQSTFLFIAILTSEGTTFKQVKSALEPLYAYEQSIEKEGDFIIRTYRSGGTGIQTTAKHIYVAKNGEIVDTDVDLVTEGILSIPPMGNQQEGVSQSYVGDIFDMSYKVGTDDDKWLMFQYQYTETDTITEEILYEKTEIYTYDKTLSKYLRQHVSESAKAGTKGEAFKSDQGVYALESLMAGMTLEGFDVAEAYSIKGDELGFKLIGDKVLKGKLLVDEMYGDYMFKSDEPLLTAPIRMTNGDEVYDIDRPTMAYFDQSFIENLTSEQKASLASTGSAEVSVNITGFSVMQKIGTEGGENIDLKELKWLEQEMPIGEMPTFQNETFVTNEQGTITLDYSNLSCVVLPMADSVNASQLNQIQVSFEGAYLNLLKFTVIGKIVDVKVNNVMALGEEGEWEYLGDVENSVVVISANLPSDMSSVMVHYGIDTGNGDIVYNEFSLDNMRDVSEYMIYTY